ncbi:MAG: hypothetical protein EBS19_13655 [Spirochaetia bacterium]|nr:hypothetical protein [Spirochaetia bacterium]
MFEKINSIRKFLRFQYNYLKLGLSIYRDKAVWKTHESRPNQVVTVMFDAEKVANPDKIAIELKNEFSDAYSAIHGYPPIVLVVPNGFRFQFLEATDFVSCLPPKAKSQLKTALYMDRDRENGEI